MMLGGDFAAAQVDANAQQIAIAKAISEIASHLHVLDTQRLIFDVNGSAMRPYDNNQRRQLIPQTGDAAISPN